MKPPTCPACHAPLPGNPSAKVCPACGHALDAPRPPDAEPELDLPCQLGRYRLTALGNVGKFAQVYHGLDEELGRVVAVKVLHRRLLATESARNSFLKEARVLASLDHPGIVPVYDVGRTPDGLFFLVAKWVDGGDLKGRLQQGRFTPEEAAGLVAAVAEALHHAHQRGLIHRDVKPANILLDTAGHPLLADFGLALRQEEFGTGPKAVGTPLYMSPEQARNEGHLVDARSDVYSLGVVFYELLTGQHPFRGRGLAELLDFICNQEAKTPRQLDPAVPEELERVWARATARRAADRYASAGDLASDLRLFLVNSEVNPPSAIRHPQSPTVVPRGLRAFGREDADFFLSLLPGPRNRDGLPESVAVWKERLDSTDPDVAPRVGLLYGPSGCGKSSLVRAGLLPRLDRHVAVLFAEACHQQTEDRLRRGLLRLCPGLPAEVGLAEAIGRVRLGEGLPEGQKVVLVVDQFEQWLHAPYTAHDARLTEALRQCDGVRVQCLLLVRDDFWLAVNRFLRGLDVTPQEGRNAALVDLFEPEHARRVLAEFGRAYGRLPADLAQCTPDQNRFLDEAVAALSVNGRVVPVWLSLFTELVKTRPWEHGTLRAAGGAEGLGVLFLEETFSSPTAPAAYRFHQRAALAVLQALLPPSGSDLKRLRSYPELLDASGYAREPEVLDELLRLLDQGLRLVTPVSGAQVGSGNPIPAGGEPAAAEDAPTAYFQLAHDYLVPSLRHWLARRQRLTARGRAELRLDERAADWSLRPGARQLPAWWEWANIRLLTRRRTWTAPQRAMMAAADRHYALRSLAAALLLGAAAVGWGSLRAHLREERQASQAAHLVAEVRNFSPDRMGQFRDGLRGLQRWAVPALETLAEDPTASPADRLHARLVLLAQDPGQLGPLREALLTAEPREFLEARAVLQPSAAELRDDLWSEYRRAGAAAGVRFRAACALAAFDPDSPRWARTGPAVADLLLQQDVAQLGQWLEALAPVRESLLPALDEAFRAHDRPERQVLAADVLAFFLAGQPERVAELVLDANAGQLPRLLPGFLAQPGPAAALMVRELDRTLPAGAPEADREAFARRQARAAFLLLRLGHEERVWPLLRHTPDPGVRTELVGALRAPEIDGRLLLRRWREEPDASARRALLLCLGERGPGTLEPAGREAFVRELLPVYRQDPDPGTHAAVDWLLRRWGMGALLRPVDEDLARQPPAGKRWAVNGQGQTLVIVEGPVEFLMGSPPDEAGRGADEPRHTRRIPRSFALANREVTVEQYRKSLDQAPGALRSYERRYSPEEDCPVLAVTWYEAARYCRWLSEQEGVPEDQMCFPPRDEIRPGMRLPADVLRRTGYRLPTEAEWEYACRAGAVTSRCYGSAAGPLPAYAWYGPNAQNHTWPAGQLRPNDLGLFDAYGNLSEWCLERYLPYLTSGGTVADDQEDATVSDGELRVVRGGSFIGLPREQRSAARSSLFPSEMPLVVGFRVARTWR